MTNKLLSAALQYASQGYNVFPCLPGSKAPATKDGFKSATTDPQVIENWWRQWPNANVAIACGAASNLFVLDVDGPEGFESASKLGLPPFPTVSTPAAGGHYYFDHIDGLKNKVGFEPGLDIRSEGSYVLASPSIHPNGGTYKAGPLKRGIKVPLVVSGHPALQAQPKQPIRASNEESDVIEGGRNAYLTKMGGALRRFGLSEAAIEAALLTHNLEKCSPPLSDTEVASISRSVSRYAPDAIALDTLQPEEAPLLERGGSDLVRGSELFSSTLLYLRDKDKVKGQPTHMEGLDKLLGGGKRLGEMTVTHAEAKVGKNTLWHQLMYNWLELSIPIGYASREITPESEVIPNLLSLEFKENAWLSQLEGEDGEARAERYNEKIKGWPLYFSAGYGVFPLKDLVAWVENGVQAGIQYFWIDHLHYCLEDPEDHKEASKFIKELKTLAKQKNIHIDIIVQPNKMQPDQKLSLNSIKGGSAMGQALDNLITLERVKGEGVKNIVKLTLEVARSKLAKPGHIYLKYDTETTLFTEVEEEEAQPQAHEPKFPIARPFSADEPLTYSRNNHYMPDEDEKPKKVFKVLF